MAEEVPSTPKIKYKIVRVDEALSHLNPYAPRPAMRIMVYIEGLGYRTLYVPKEEMSEETIEKRIREEYETKWKYEMMSGEV